MRSTLTIIVCVGILVGCGLPPTTSRHDPVVSTNTADLPSPTSTTLPFTPPTPSSEALPARGWHIPSGLSYTRDGQLFSVNLADGSSRARGAAPPTSAIHSPDGAWYWITDAGIATSRDDGTTFDLILPWATFAAQFPTYHTSARRLSLSDDQRVIFFDASYLSPGGFVCSVFALTIATRTVTSHDLDCGVSQNPATAPVLAADGSYALARRRNMPDPPGLWLESTFLFQPHRHDGGQLLNPAGLLDAVWLSNGRFIYAVDPGSSELLPEMAADAQRIILADQQGQTLHTLATDVIAVQLALAPDEQQIAYITGDAAGEMPADHETDAPQELWVSAVDGSGARKLATLPGKVTALRWTP